jgi:RNA polymerase sigma factor (sigma-70 family)
MSLKLPSDVTNFPLFYNENRKEMNRILIAVCRKHQLILTLQHMEIEDMCNELYIKLADSSVLSDFDPKQSQLHTYMTNRARHYAQHLVTKLKTKHEKSGQAVSFQELNALGDNDLAPELPSREKGIDQEIVFKDIIERVKEKCPNNLKLLSFLENDVSILDIAKHMGVSTACVRIQLNSLRKTLKPLYTEVSEEVPVKEVHHDKPATKVSSIVKIDNSIVKINEPKIETVKLIVEPKIEPVDTNTIATVVKPIKKSKPIKKEIYMMNKNHHAIEKKRPLTKNEIKKIKDRFIELDGVIPYKTWSKLKETMKSDISVYQISGEGVKFHNEVKNGSIILKDKKAYEKALEAKHEKWKTYDSPRYRKMSEGIKTDTKTAVAKIKARTKSQMKAVTKTIKAKAPIKTLKVKAIEHKTEVKKIPVRIAILKHDLTWEERKILTETKVVDKFEIPGLLGMEKVPDDVADFVVLA